MDDIMYFANEEKGIVVAKMPKEKVEAMLEEFYNKIGKESKYGGFIFDKTVLMKFAQPIIAKAVCSESDVYDYNIGQEIARKKLLEKLALRKAKVCQEIARIYIKETARICGMSTRYLYKAEKAEKEVSECIKKIFE